MRQTGGVGARIVLTGGRRWRRGYLSCTLLSSVWWWELWWLSWLVVVVATGWGEAVVREGDHSNKVG